MYAQNGAEKILGKWTNEDKTRVIEFVQNGNTYDAIIREAADKNMIGQKQITGLRSVNDVDFSDGTVFIIKKGKTAKCTATRKGEHTLQIHASYGMMSKTQIWTKL
jgi:uncharacterized protein (DUF2147 family)